LCLPELQHWSACLLTCEGWPPSWTACSLGNPLPQTGTSCLAVEIIPANPLSLALNYVWDPNGRQANVNRALQHLYGAPQPQNTGFRGFWFLGPEPMRTMPLTPVAFICGVRLYIPQKAREGNGPTNEKGLGVGWTVAYSRQEKRSRGGGCYPHSESP